MLTRTVGTIATLFLFALRGGAIPLGVLYNNLSDGTQTNHSVSAVGPLYDSFSTGSVVTSLVHVQLKLLNVGPILYRLPSETPLLLRAGYFRPAARVRPHDGGGSITVGLYADSSTSPGALLSGIGTLTDDSLTTMLANYDFPLGSAYPLAANQRYWIGISTNNGSIAGWAVAQDDSGFGVPSEFWYASGMAHPNTDPPFQMLVGGSSNISPAAAPSTFILVLVGLAGASLYWNRRRIGTG